MLTLLGFTVPINYVVILVFFLVGVLCAVSFFQQVRLNKPLQGLGVVLSALAMPIFLALAFRSGYARETPFEAAVFLASLSYLYWQLNSLQRLRR